FSHPLDPQAFIRRMSEEQIGPCCMLDGFIPSSASPFRRSRYVDELFQASEDLEYSKHDWTLDVGGIAVEGGRAIEEAIGSIYPLSPFRRPPSRWYIYSGSEVRNVGFDGELLPDLLFRTPSLVKETNRWLDSLQTGYTVKIQP